MNAITKQQTLSTPQTVRLTQLIGEAVTGFKRKFNQIGDRPPTDQEIDIFTRGVEPSIVASILKADANHSKAKREDRLKAVKALATLHGVKFAHRRELEEEVVNDGSYAHTARGYTEFFEVELTNATRGGQSIAFKYKLDELNNLAIDYAVSFCRNDENFDPLIGMEESLKKFLANHVLSAPITHEQFGQVKLTQFSETYKEAEEAAKAFIAQAKA